MVDLRVEAVELLPLAALLVPLLSVPREVPPVLVFDEVDLLVPDLVAVPLDFVAVPPDLDVVVVDLAAAPPDLDAVLPVDREVRDFVPVEAVARLVVVLAAAVLSVPREVPPVLVFDEVDLLVPDLVAVPLDFVAVPPDLDVVVVDLAAAPPDLDAVLPVDREVRDFVPAAELVDFAVVRPPPVAVVRVLPEPLLVVLEVPRLAVVPALAEPARGSFRCPPTTSLNWVPARKAGTFVFLTRTASPVRGLRAVRAARARFSKTPKPVMFTFSPLLTLRTIRSTTLSTA